MTGAPAPILEATDPWRQAFRAPSSALVYINCGIERMGAKRRGAQAGRLDSNHWR